MMYLGDYAEDAVVYFSWPTSDLSGGAITRATDGTIQVYKDDGTAEETANITDTEDFDSLTGVHNCKIDTSVDAFFATGHDYSVVLNGAVIDGQTVNTVLAMFSIENRFMRGTDSGATSSALSTHDAKLDTLDTVADGLQTDLDNGTDGLGALKALIDTLTTNVGTVDTVVDGLQTDLSNGTDGLGALKTLIDAVNTDLSNGTDGLGALKALIDTANTALAHGTYGLSALQVLLAALQTDLDNGTDGLGALLTAIQADVTLADGAHGGSSAVLTLAKLRVQSSGNDIAVLIEGSGTGKGLLVVGGATGHAVNLLGGGTSGQGLRVETGGSGNACELVASGGEGDGLRIAGGDVSGDGVEVNSDNASGKAIKLGGPGDLFSFLNDALLALFLASLATGETGTAETGTLSTTQCTTDLTEDEANTYVNRWLYFTSGVAAKQAVRITAYAVSDGLLTFTPLTIAPENGDTFVIL